LTANRTSVTPAAQTCRPRELAAKGRLTIPETFPPPPISFSLQNLLIFSDDWGRHPSSCQYLTGEWLRSSGGDANVVWVNTIGTRPPRLDWLTLRRGLEKAGSWIRPRADLADSALPQGLQVVNPRMWPWIASPAARRINRRLLASQLTPLLRCEARWTAVTTIPIAAVVLDSLPVERWVYYCVDDFSVWPGLDGQTLLDLERAVVERADEIICASDSLAERIGRLGRTSRVITHGVDCDFWASGQGKLLVASEIAPAPGPRAVFWGVVDRRLDTDWLIRLSASPDIGSIILVGPHQNPDPAIFSLPKVVATGAMPMADLPAVAAAADVLVMPYRDEAVTRAMQPLKLKEYLATGRPVVVRSLPATDSWGDCCDVTSSADEFVAVTATRARGTIPDCQIAARRRLVAESWKSKARSFWPIVIPSLVRF
jgi:glycosyltransferase involved in cell wall biosynthesis